MVRATSLCSGTKLSILKDREGFVTACGPTRDDIARERTRAQLCSPIHVWRWDRHPNHHGQVVMGWKLVEEFIL